MYLQCSGYVQMCVYINLHTVGPVYYLGTNHNCPDHQGALIFQVSKAPIWITTECVGYLAGVLIFLCSKFHYTYKIMVK